MALSSSGHARFCPSAAVGTPTDPAKEAQPTNKKSQNHFFQSPLGATESLRRVHTESLMLCRQLLLYQCHKSPEKLASANFWMCQSACWTHAIRFLFLCRTQTKTRSGMTSCARKASFLPRRTSKNRSAQRRRSSWWSFRSLLVSLRACEAMCPLLNL